MMFWGQNYAFLWPKCIAKFDTLCCIPTVRFKVAFHALDYCNHDCSTIKSQIHGIDSMYLIKVKESESDESLITELEMSVYDGCNWMIWQKRNWIPFR